MSCPEEERRRPHAGACRVLAADIFGNAGNEPLFRTTCVGRLHGDFWRSWPGMLEHLEPFAGRDRKRRELLGRLNATMAWFACLTLSCASLPPPARHALVWQHFMEVAKADEAIPPPPVFTTTVALVIRTYAGAISELLPLLRSAELFWPYWRWPVVLVLDAESAADWWMASVMVPRWVRTLFEPPPPRFEEWPEVEHDGSKGRGWQRAAWSQFYFDRYAAGAEFVAQIDADAVLHTWVDEELLFDDRGRPRMTGATRWLEFKPVVRALGLPSDIEFMAGQPMLVRRRHFEDTRRFVAARMGARDFDEAFSLLSRAVLRNNTPGKRPGLNHLPCQQSATGAYLWEFHRPEYAWHILWRHRVDRRRRWDSAEGTLRALPPDVRHQCPQVYVGSHLGAWGMQDIKGFAQDRAPAPFQGGQRYVLKSLEVVMLQLCATRLSMLEYYGPGVREVADRLVSAPAPQDAAAAPGGPQHGPAPEAVCKSVESGSSVPDVLLGLSSIAFWKRDQDRAFCTPRKLLLEAWARHAARHALCYLASWTGPPLEGSAVQAGAWVRE